MKAKIIFLLAAIMLSCASAFAQSGPIDPAKGDVNEDGTVDVADMVSIIKIMKDGGGAIGEKQAYWYAGTNGGNAVTADNFTDVASKIPESEIPAAGFVTANGQYVYIVLPETRHIESLTDVNNADVEFTCTDVMGYHIYKTTELINTQINYTVAQTVYYWYVGQTKPTSQSSVTAQDDVAFTNNNWHTINVNNTYSFSNPIYNSESNPIIGDSNTNWYIALPADKSYGIYDSDDVNEVTAGNITKVSTITITNVTYNIYKTVGTYRKFNGWWIH